MVTHSIGDRQPGLRLAQAALVVGLVFAAVSAYWGLGGTWLLDTVGGSLERRARAGEGGVLLMATAALFGTCGGR